MFLIMEKRRTLVVSAQTQIAQSDPLLVEIRMKSVFVQKSGGQLSAKFVSSVFFQYKIYGGKPLFVEQPYLLITKLNREQLKFPGG